MKLPFTRTARGTLRRLARRTNGLLRFFSGCCCATHYVAARCTYIPPRQDPPGTPTTIYIPKQRLSGCTSNPACQIAGNRIVVYQNLCYVLIPSNIPLPPECVVDQRRTLAAATVVPPPGATIADSAVCIDELEDCNSLTCGTTPQPCCAGIAANGSCGPNQTCPDWLRQDLSYSEVEIVTTTQNPFYEASLNQTGTLVDTRTTRKTFSGYWLCDPDTYTVTSESWTIDTASYFNGVLIRSSHVERPAGWSRGQAFHCGQRPTLVGPVPPCNGSRTINNDDPPYSTDRTVEEWSNQYGCGGGSFAYHSTRTFHQNPRPDPFDRIDDYSISKQWSCSSTTCFRNPFRPNDFSPDPQSLYGIRL